MNDDIDISFRLDQGEWTNQELVDQLLQGHDDGTKVGNWIVARWQDVPPESGGLTIQLMAPRPELDQPTLLKLADLVRQKLANGFFQACKERGWPLPRFFVSTGTIGSDSEWTYRLQLGPGKTEPVVIHPNKILAVGEEECLAPLLGLECVDPVFGLPAKWVTYSQAEKAAASGSLLFEASEVIMSHAISFTESRMAHAVGHWEVFRWLASGLPSAGERGCRLLSEKSPAVVQLVQELLSEGLHLPQPAVFCEEIDRALSQEVEENSDELSALVRKAIVRHNLSRWFDQEGSLNAVEWKGPAQLQTHDHHRMLARLSQALERLHSRLASGTPVLMVDFRNRRQLAAALESLFPDLPVLAWSELEDLAPIRIVDCVNADLKVDPSVVPASFFSVN